MEAVAERIKLNLVLLTVEELKALGFSELIPEALRQKRVFKKPSPPICVRVNRIDYLLPPTLTVILGEYGELLDFTPTPIEAPYSLTDKSLVEYLLFDLPEVLENERSPVLVRDLSERFSTHVYEGVEYCLNILARVSKVYNVSTIVCDKTLELPNKTASLTIIVGKINGKTVAQIAETNEIFYL